MDMQIPAVGEVSLEHLGVIRARGADATTFLQGQLTNDVATLGLAQARLAGFCSAKGRLQASFIVWRSTDDEVLLACSASVLAPTLKRLSMFVLRAQCKLSDATAEMRLRGQIGSVAAQAIGAMRAWEKRDDNGVSVIRLPDAAGQARSIIAGIAGAAAESLPTAASSSPAAASPPTTASSSSLSLDHWRWLEVQSGIPTIEAATVDRFVPQMLNFEVLGGVDFQKGCYPGQEVVARSQYRGTIKRRMFLFDCEAPAVAGQEVFHGGDAAQPAGMVVNAAPAPQRGWSALVEMKLAALDGGTLHLGSVEGPALHPGELPYPLPVAA